MGDKQWSVPLETQVGLCWGKYFEAVDAQKIFTSVSLLIYTTRSYASSPGPLNALTRMSASPGEPGPAPNPPPGRNPTGRRPGSTPPQTPLGPSPCKLMCKLAVASRNGPTRISSTLKTSTLPALAQPSYFSGNLHAFPFFILGEIYPPHHWVRLRCLIDFRLQQLSFIFQLLGPVPGPRPYPTLSLRSATGLYRYAPCLLLVLPGLASHIGLRSRLG